MVIELSADVGKFEKAMNEAYKSARSLESRMKDINSQLKLRPNDKQLYGQAFATLHEQLSVAKNKLDELNKVYYKACRDFANGKIGQAEFFQLQRDIKATETEIRKFEKSLENIKTRASSFEEIRAKIDKVDEGLKNNKKLLKDVNAALKLDPKNIDLVTSKQDLLTKSISETKNKIDLCKQAQEELVREFNNNTFSNDEYTKRYANLRIELGKAKQELKNLVYESDIARAKLEQMGNGLNKIGNGVTEIGKTMTTKVTVPIATGMGLAVKETTELEDAMTGVRKTTDMTDKELQTMEDTFISMSKTTPVAAKELANIGELAGQLGIKKENIAEFSKTISDLTIATNLTKEQGSMDLARFMNITQMSQDEVSNLGSAIVDLGNNFATTEDDIVQMALRLSAQGEIAGLTEAQTLGLATALSSVGLKAEQGGSSFSRIMLKMNTAVLGTEERISMLNNMLQGTGYTINDVKNAMVKGGKEGKAALNEIGEAIGMSGDDLKELAGSAENSKNKLEVLGQVSGLGAKGFAEAWRKDPMKAIEAFIGGLKKMKDGNKDLSLVFDALDMKGIRETDTLQRLTNANDELGKAVDTATKAYKENTALSHEVEIFNKTTSNQFKILKNDAIALGIKMGKVLLPSIKNLVEWFKDWVNKVEKMDPSKIEFMVKALLGLAAIGPIVLSVGKLGLGLGNIILFASKVSGELALLNSGMAASATGAGLFAQALTWIGGILSFPGGVVALGLVAAGIYLKELNDHMQEAVIQTDIFGDGVSEGTKKAVQGYLDLDEQATIALNELKATGDTVSQETVDSISKTFADMGGKIAKAIEERKSEAKDSLTKMYEELGAIHDESNTDIIDKVIKTYDQIEQENQEGQDRVKEILEKAKEEKRGLTEKEREEINTIQNNMKDDGIRVLSESEQEYLIIRQRMKDQVGEISAEQASKMVKDSLHAKDETIKTAEEEYNTRILIAEGLRAKGGEEANKLADTIIEQAQKARDESIKAAEERHSKIVEEAKKQAGDHVREVNWETGEILTGWELFNKNSAENWEKMRENILYYCDVADKKIAKFKETVKRRGKEIIEGFVNGMIKSWVNRIQRFVDIIINSFNLIVVTIEKMFDFTLPMPRVPKPYIHWETHSVLGMNFSIPSGVSWYKKGGIFTKPTLFNTPYGMKGVGEAGAEAVLPIEKLDSIVANALIKADGLGGGVTITGNTFNVREEDDIEKIAQKLYTMIERKKRGVGLG